MDCEIGLIETVAELLKTLFLMNILFLFTLET